MYVANLQAPPTPANGLILQARNPSRCTLVDVDRTGQKAYKLTTMPGDDNIVGSGDMRRCDVYQAAPGTADPLVYGDGIVQWWAHSIFLPRDEFVMPAGDSCVLFDFHNKPDVGHAAPFHVNFVNWLGDLKRLGQLQIQRFTGDPDNPTPHASIIGPAMYDTWYDFLYHVCWTDQPWGFFDAWVNGLLVMRHKGPTLYRGSKVYAKLAHYHIPRPGYESQPSSVIHDRLMRGETREQVAI